MSKIPNLRKLSTTKLLSTRHCVQRIASVAGSGNQVTFKVRIKCLGKFKLSTHAPTTSFGRRTEQSSSYQLQVSTLSASASTLKNNPLTQVHNPFGVTPALTVHKPAKLRQLNPTTDALDHSTVVVPQNFTQVELFEGSPSI